VPFSSKRRVSLRVRNFETARLKVADADGNPVEIAAVVVWRVVDTFKAAFGVDNHIDYVAVQPEAAVRHLAPATHTRPTTRAAPACATARRSPTSSAPSSVSACRW